MRTVSKLRSVVYGLGLLATGMLIACASPEKSSIHHIPRATLEDKIHNSFRVQEVNSSQVRSDIQKLTTAVKRGRLSEAEWRLHDKLLDLYIQLKWLRGSKITVPPYSSLTLDVESYCLNGRKASPVANERYIWRNGNPAISFYNELLHLRREGQVTKAELQEIIWNIANKTYWEDYPHAQKQILLKANSRAPFILPSRTKDQVKDLIMDSAGMGFLNTVAGTLDLIEGKYHTYKDFREAVESLTSQIPLAGSNTLRQVPGTSLYSDSQSQSFRNQTLTLFNPTDKSQKVNLEDYYLDPERSDVQEIGITHPKSLDPELIADIEKLLFMEMARFGLGLIPALGDLADIYELVTGRGVTDNAVLSSFDRFLSGLGIVAGSGAAYRYAKKATHVPEKHFDTFLKPLSTSSRRKLTFDRKRLDEASDVLSSSRSFTKRAKQVGKIATPYGPASQELSKEALQTRAKVEVGQNLYRLGRRGKSNTGDQAQFWSLDNPNSSDYAKKYGIPPENTSKADFVEMGKLKPGAPFVTRTSPGVGKNSGGAIEVVVPEGGVAVKGHIGR